MRARTRLIAGMVAGTLLLAAAGCSSEDSTDSGGNGSGGKLDPGTVRVLAGSEIKDLAPVLDEATKATGVRLSFDYTGTLEGAERIANGGADGGYDAAWFSSNSYLSMIDGGTAKISNPTKTMISPVVLGLRKAKVAELGWDKQPPTWATIAKAAGEKKFTFGMTNPSSSNSGFSALLGIASALNGGRLDAAGAAKVTPQLKTFFKGQTLTSGSSGWLAERYASLASTGGAPDGLINYESVILDLNASHPADQQLVPVYPTDGVTYADYPLAALASADEGKKDQVKKLTDWLLSDAGQRLIMQRTARRPMSPGVQLDPRFGSQLPAQINFPGDRKVADGLISAYLNVIRKPTQTVYVIDTSGSMAGSRIDQLKAALSALTSSDGQDSFTRFRNREKVVLLTFSSTPGSPRTFDIPEADPQAALDQIKHEVDGLDTGGGTAIYSSMDAAYQEAGRLAKENEDAFTSVVLMTDGENTEEHDASWFNGQYAAMDGSAKRVPTFAIMFGDSVPRELKGITETTGGKVFDAKSSDLTSVFKEIRGYQ